MIDKLMSRRCLIEAAAGALLLSGCSSQDESSTKKVKKQDKIKKADSSDGTKHLRDKDELYEVYDDSGIVTMYLTVSRGNSSENTDHSWGPISAQSSELIGYATSLSSFRPGTRGRRCPACHRDRSPRRGTRR